MYDVCLLRRSPPYVTSTNGSRESPIRTEAEEHVHVVAIFLFYSVKKYFLLRFDVFQYLLLWIISIH
jgi:hypothetical protein